MKIKPDIKKIQEIIKNIDTRSDLFWKGVLSKVPGLSPLLSDLLQIIRGDFHVLTITPSKWYVKGHEYNIVSLKDHYFECTCFTAKHSVCKHILAVLLKEDIPAEVVMLLLLVNPEIQNYIKMEKK
jgi:hypothetical protein